MEKEKTMNLLNYQDFLEEIKETIRENLEEPANIRITKVMKNNSVFLDGLSIMKENDNIAPSIYLNDFYQDYLKGEEFHKIISKILYMYENNKVASPINLEFFTEFGQVKEMIVAKLINYDKNLELLNDVPHIKILDLAIVFYCLISCDATGNATILIHNNHEKMWNVSTEELLGVARENNPKLLSANLKTMEEVLKEILTEDLSEEINSLTDDSEDSTKMYVLTNDNKLHGAICMFYPHVLKNLSDKLERDLYILPSSIHEVIIIPVSGNHRVEELQAMVCEVNDTQVSKEEILSYEVYFYDRKLDEIILKMQ